MGWLTRLVRQLLGRSGSKLGTAASPATPFDRAESSESDWDRLWNVYRDEGYDALSDAQVVWLTVRGVIDATNDGGIVSYFYNSWADNYDDAVESLGILDAQEVLLTLQSIGDLFGPEVPSDGDERNDIINVWPDSGEESQMMEAADKYLDQHFDDLEQRLADYLTSEGLDPRMYPGHVPGKPRRGDGA